MSKFAKISVKIIKDLDKRALDEIRNRLKATSRKIRVGVPDSSQEKDGTATALIGAVHEFGSPTNNIPERPFLRTTMKKHGDKYVNLNRVNLVRVMQGQMKVEQALGQLGEAVVGDVKQTIKDGQFDPLMPATIKRKGSSKPLIDTGQLRQSISWTYE